MLKKRSRAKRICRWREKEKNCKTVKKCKTILTSYNKEPYCFAHQKKALMDEAMKTNFKLLKESKKFAQISSWVEDWKKLRHFKQTPPTLLLCQRKNKSKQCIEYAVFAKTSEKGVELKKLKLAKKIQF
ncbi:MAG: hypothetical protein Q8N22_01475 [bacterium]|nr:hypothetical protein [bacterium]